MRARDLHVQRHGRTDAIGRVRARLAIETWPTSVEHTVRRHALYPRRSKSTDRGRCNSNDDGDDDDDYDDDENNDVCDTLQPGANAVGTGGCIAGVRCTNFRCSRGIYISDNLERIGLNIRSLVTYKGCTRILSISISNLRVTLYLHRDCSSSLHG